MTDTTAPNVDKPRQKESAWMIWFDDQSIGPTIFTGNGSERAARHQFDLDGQNWSCHLFRKVASHE